MKKWILLSLAWILPLASLSAGECIECPCDPQKQINRYRAMARQVERDAERLRHIQVGQANRLQKKAAWLRQKACELEQCKDRK